MFRKIIILAATFVFVMPTPITVGIATVSMVVLTAETAEAQISIPSAGGGGRRRDWADKLNEFGSDFMKAGMFQRLIAGAALAFIFFAALRGKKYLWHRYILAGIVAFAGFAGGTIRQKVGNEYVYNNEVMWIALGLFVITFALGRILAPPRRFLQAPTPLGTPAPGPGGATPTT